MPFSKNDIARAMRIKIASIRKKGLRYPRLEETLDLIEKQIASEKMPLKWYADMGLIIDGLLAEVQDKRPRKRCVYGFTNDATDLIKRTGGFPALFFCLLKNFNVFLILIGPGHDAPAVEFFLLGPGATGKIPHGCPEFVLGSAIVS